MEKTVVLGATGQLGAETSLYLKEKGYEVVAVGHRISDNGFFKTKDIEFIGGFSLEDPESFNKLPSDIDAVVHLAGTMPAHADNNPMPYVQSIIVGMVNVCEWMKRINCKRIIFNTTPSDVAAFFGKPIPVKDDAPRSFPKDGGDHAVYAISKNAAVDILEHYKYSDGISSCIFRHLTVYGYQPNPYYFLNGVKKILPWRYIIQQAELGNAVEIWGDKNRKKELLYIKDFCRAIEAALKTGAEGIYNLPGYKPYTLEEQVEGIVEVFSPEANKSEIIYCPEKADTPQNLLEGTKIKEKMNWEPVFDWIEACKDIKRQSELNPFEILWGKPVL